MRAGPVIIGFDGSPAAEQAVRGAAALLAPKAALVVFVWEAGRGFAAATLPERALDEPPGAGAFDISAGFEAERAASDSAQQLAERGAALAREAGLPAGGQAVTDDATVADTLIRLARERDAQAIVVGLHEHHRLTKMVPSRTLTLPGGDLRRARLTRRLTPAGPRWRAARWRGRRWRSWGPPSATRCSRRGGRGWPRRG
jgi:nucleotide-binding universal stress UspA family protein